MHGDRRAMAAGKPDTRQRLRIRQTVSSQLAERPRLVIRTGTAEDCPSTRALGRRSPRTECGETPVDLREIAIGRQEPERNERPLTN